MNVGVNLICALVFLFFVNGFLGFDLDRASVDFQILKSGMASSQVEFASSAPLGCVLRDHNRRERCATFQKNLKDLVRGHLHTCISNSDENTQNAEGWTNRRSNKSEELLPPDGRHRPRADEIENSPPQSESSVEIPNLGGVSSLVQRWRDFADAKIIKKLGANANANEIPNPNASSSSGGVCSASRTSSVTSCPESTIESVESVDERFDTPSTVTEDSFTDWESDRNTQSRPPSAQGRVHSEEKERPRVADVIKKLTSENQMQGCLMSWKSEHDRDTPPLENEPLPPLRVARDCTLTLPERCLRGPVLNSPKIRGRQAFSDLLMQMERDRLRELDTLMERRAVSKFSHRGRIQACLRLRFMLRDAANQQCAQPKPVGSKQHKQREEAKLPPKRPSKSKVVDPHPSNSTSVGPQQSRRRKAVGRDQSSSRENEVGAQQHSDPTTVRSNQQHSSSGAIDRDKQSDEAVPRDGLPLPSTPSEPRPLKHSSAVILLREKFDALIESEPSDTKTSRGGKASEAPAVSSSNQQKEEPHHQPVVTIDRQNEPSAENSVSCSQHVLEPAIPNSDKSCQGTSSVQDPQGAMEILACSNERKEDSEPNLAAANEHMTSGHPREDQEPTFKELTEISNEHVRSEHPREDQEPTFEKLTEIANEHVRSEHPRENQEATFEEQTETANDHVTSEHPREDQEPAFEELTEIANEHVTTEHSREDEQPTFHELMETEQDWVSEASHGWSEWDEQEYNDYMMGTGHDWITDIARPRRDWEDLRQARYQEMLDPYMENQDIRRLLERRSVSTFLSSNLREAMDQLMMSRMEILPQAMQTRQEDNLGFHNRLEQVMMSHIQRQAHTTNSPQVHTVDSQQADEEHEEAVGGEHEEERVEEDVVDEEERHNAEEVEARTEEHHQYGDGDSFLDQAPADVSPWIGNVDMNYDSDQVSSPSLQQPLSSHSSHQDRPFSSCTNRSSVEMELMYFFRGHMEQLHQEMQELRKSINSCMTMQEEMQKAIKQEVAAALNQSAVREVGKESRKGFPKKGSCCICCEVKVDCLLYRCGHMCTCFKCALELQWSSGKCPICRAPIVDVVRAYADT